MLTKCICAATNRVSGPGYMQDINEDDSDINNKDQVSDIDEVADPTDGSSVEHSNVVNAEVSDVDNEDNVTTFT